MLRFTPRVQELRIQLDTVIFACDEIPRSEKLRVILGVVLKVGNQLNEGGGARAFTLDFDTELNHVQAARRISMEGIESEANELGSGLRDLRESASQDTAATGAEAAATAGESPAAAAAADTDAGECKAAATSVAQFLCDADATLAQIRTSIA